MHIYIEKNSETFFYEASHMQMADPASDHKRLYYLKAKSFTLYEFREHVVFSKNSTIFELIWRNFS